jgi:hypothetical protein
MSGLPPDVLLAQVSKLADGPVVAMLPGCPWVLFAWSGNICTMRTNATDRDALFGAVRHHIDQTVRNDYPNQLVRMDSHGFVTFFHPDGNRAGSLDTNRITADELQKVVDAMRHQGRGRK